MGAAALPRLEPAPGFPVGSHAAGRKEGEYDAVIPGADIDPKFDLMYYFEVMDNAGNGMIYPDLSA